ncbi:HAD-hyrolase-like protein [Aureococcus anophagefferens]|nr:HAD-hyrolase-like protein [Aureococcus anophagefferens]
MRALARRCAALLVLKRGLALSPRTLITFDVDSTLVKGSSAQAEASAHARSFAVATGAVFGDGAPTGLPAAEGARRRAGGRRAALPEVCAMCASVAGVDDEAFAVGIEPLPGVVVTLTALASDPRVVCGLVTGNVEAIAEEDAGDGPPRSALAPPDPEQVAGGGLAAAEAESAFLGGFGSDFCSGDIDDADRNHLDRGEQIAIAWRRARRAHPSLERLVHVGDAPADVLAARACALEGLLDGDDGPGVVGCVARPPSTPSAAARSASRPRTASAMPLALRAALVFGAALAMAPRSAGPPKRPKSAPRRITSDSVKTTGLSLKTQLSLVRAVKKKGDAPPRERRRVNKAGASKKAENVTAPPPALYEKTSLFVDGYNAIFGDKDLDATSRGPGGLDGARERLIRGCDVLCESRNWEGTVCFDAHSTDDELTEERVSPRLTVVYTAERQTADAYLEAAAAARKPLGAGATVVASNDGMVRLMATAQQASTMRVDALMDAVAGADRALASRMGAIRAANALGRGGDGEYARSAIWRTATRPRRGARATRARAPSARTCRRCWRASRRATAPRAALGDL